MKKLSLFLIVLLAFISCEDNVKFNNPSVQGLKDNVFWRAVDSKATLVNGALTIVAVTGNETLTFKTTSTTKQTYPLGTSVSKTATYVLKNTDGTKTTFTTGIGIGEGQIVITDYDAENNTVSGTFKFNAEKTDDNSDPAIILNFQQGVFYKVPVSSL
ncbi:DUF6252 family protein [Flavobacterium lacustre]|uniref:DUF6252 family protein n=1 Tax=Flavobacterium lacustre TaxID=3016339 RepID=UPI0022B6C274|nr:DUF6252 family protein [Flavobacterium lacustre]